ncbi:DnaJ-like protein subfamily C member 7 [Camelus dromedarius]|uniref:DnaJ-like protein subfamily C member 7 n=1 Tax=Camelus dromedarius TaxID=9838 RepID=A0A5N4DSC3_CAMDR|nr:DnaJ-like protein subfamily C member 7 [Camelus dromedarius]
MDTEQYEEAVQDYEKVHQVEKREHKQLLENAQLVPKKRKKFKEVGEAFTILSDPKKKTRYDTGQDLDEEGIDTGDFDASNIVKAFFSCPGDFSFEVSGPGNFFFSV